MCFHRDTSCRDLMSSLATRLVPRDKSHGSFYIVSIQIGDFNRLLKIKRSYFFFYFILFLFRISNDCIPLCTQLSSIV